MNLEKQSESLANEKKSLNEKIIQLEHQLIEKNSELKAENWKLNQELFKVDALKESLENEKKQMIQKLHSERALFEVSILYNIKIFTYEYIVTMFINYFFF